MGEVVDLVQTPAAGMSRRDRGPKVTRAEWRYAQRTARIAGATTPELRLEAAFDVLRAALMDVPPAKANQIRRIVADQLIDAFDEIGGGRDA